MKIYLAGWQASRRLRELEVIHKAGIDGRCFSFANLFKIKGFPYYINGFQGSYEACLENNVGIMMDSGVFSYRNYKQLLLKKGESLDDFPTEEEFIDMYVAYCKEHSKKWDWYATVDMERSAPKIYKWHKLVLSKGIKPAPVYHGDAGLDWIKRYHDLGHDFIALGSHKTLRSSRRHWSQYLDAAFNEGARLGVEFHGLAMTAPFVMLGWPWRSVDSSWWTRSAGYGSIMHFDPVKERMSILHVSPRIGDAKGQGLKHNSVAMGKLKEEVEAQGFDFEMLQTDFTARHIYNAKAMMLLAQTATKKQRSSWEQLV